MLAALCDVPSLPLALIARSPEVAAFVNGPGRQPRPRADFAALAEALTSERAAGTIRAGYRLFMVPDFIEVCERARAGDVAGPRPASSVIKLRVSEPFDLNHLAIDAVDADGSLLSRVPIVIESEISSNVLDTRSHRIADGRVTPVNPGRILIRVRTLCDAPVSDEFITFAVTP